MNNVTNEVKNTLEGTNSIYNLISYQECKLHEMKDLLLLLFIYLSLAALGLPCWAGFSLAAAKEGFSLRWLLLLWSTGSTVFGLQSLQHLGIVIATPGV